MEYEPKEILAIILGLIALVGAIGGIANRLTLRRSMGSQFIRYMGVVVGFPIAAALLLLDMIPQAAAAGVLSILATVLVGRSN